MQGGLRRIVLLGFSSGISLNAEECAKCQGSVQEVLLLTFVVGADITTVHVSPKTTTWVRTHLAVAQSRLALRVSANRGIIGAGGAGGLALRGGNRARPLVDIAVLEHTAPKTHEVARAIAVGHATDLAFVMGRAQRIPLGLSALHFILNAAGGYRGTAVGRPTKCGAKAGLADSVFALRIAGTGRIVLGAAVHRRCADRSGLIRRRLTNPGPAGRIVQALVDNRAIRAVDDAITVVIKAVAEFGGLADPDLIHADLDLQLLESLDMRVGGSALLKRRTLAIANARRHAIGGVSVQIDQAGLILGTVRVFCAGAVTYDFTATKRA
jgi:hypothetical protein